MYTNLASYPGRWPGLSPKLIQQLLHPFVVLAMLLSLLAPALPYWLPMPAALPTANPANRQDERVTPIFTAPPAAVSTGPEAAARLAALTSAVAPTTWQGHPEIMERRDAFAHHYDLGDGRALAVVRSSSAYVQSAAGDWRIYDQRLHAVEGGFAYAQPGLGVSLGKTTSTALLQSGESLVGWQPQQLVVRSAQGTAISTLAEVIDSKPEEAATTLSAATLEADGSRVTYANHWSDATLRETFHSTDRGIEQSLIFAQAPQVVQAPGLQGQFAAIRQHLPTFLGDAIWGDGQTLVLESDLFLLSGDAIWVDGQRQYQTFSTATSATGEFSIRNRAGETLLTFAPVVAFEEADPRQRVQGHYEAELLEQHIWRLRVVTPWSWWQDPARNYPAVLDPEIYVGVIKPATITLGESCVLGPDPGMFDGCPYNPPNGTVDNFVASFGTFFRENDDGYPEPFSTLTIDSNVVFNVFPTLPTDAQITGAELVLTGSAVGSDMQLEVVNPTGGGILASFTTGNVAASATLTEANTITRAVTLADAPIVGLIQCWRTGGANQGLTIRPQQVDPGELCDSSTFHKRKEFGLGCGFFGTKAPQLLIEYADQNLIANVRLDGQPMPSVHPSLDHTQHEHKLVSMDPEWQAVGLVDNGNGAQSSLSMFGVASQFNGQQTNYLVYDNANQGVPSTTAQITVNPRTDGTDQGTYALFVDEASDVLPVPNSSWAKTTVGLYPGAPLHLFALNFPGASTLAVRVKVSAQVPTAPEFFGPHPGSSAAVGNSEWTAGRGQGRPDVQPTVDGAGNAIYSMQATNALPAPEQWVLVLPLDEIKIECPLGPPPGAAQAAAVGSACEPIQVEIETLACPLGEYPTRRWGCQSVVYPHEQIGGPIIIAPQADTTSAAATSAANIPPTRFYTVGNVRIFSEGGFIGEAPGDSRPSQSIYGSDSLNRLYNVCTENERLGMPLLGLASDNVPADSNGLPPQRLIAVQQGSVCVTDDNVIDVIGGGPVAPYSVAGEQFGALVVPSIRENQKRNVPIYADLFGEAVLLFRGYLDIGNDKDDGSQFGSLEVGRMRQNAGNQFRLDLIDGVNEVAAQPWQGWAGIHATARYIDISARAAVGTDSGTLQVAPGRAEASVGVTVNSTWQRRAELVGYGLNFSADIQVPTLTVASLESRFHASGNAMIDQESFTVRAIHMTEATIHQSAGMGGAYRPVQAVIGKPNAGIICSFNIACLDLRNATNINNPSWQLPDIDVGGPTGTVMVNAAGNLQVFSADHPAQGVNGASADFTQSFNFKAFDATVRVEQAECPVALSNNPVVTVIKGDATIGLPTLNDGAGNAGENVGGTDGETPSLQVSFTLCQSKFREAMLFFDAMPPGLPAGASGMIIESLGGKVTAAEGYVQIVLSLGYRSADGTTITNGGGTITIDTRGMFRLEGGVLQEECAEAEPCIAEDGEPMAALVTVFNVDGTLQVAWNPLDILVEVSISYEDWITGFLRMHMWRGQGWQNAYHWLPDNDDFHFTGMIGATFDLKEGRIGEFFGVELPPKDIEISVEIAFGEFCSNYACTDYEWGVQGKVKVMEFTIGLFIGKSSGVDFFIGDKDKKLIDQAFASTFANATALQATAAIPASLISDLAGAKVLDIPKDATACTPTATGDLCTFTITEGTAEALFAVGWSEGTLPTVLLHAPDGTTISAQGLVPDATASAQAGTPVYVREAGGTVRMAYTTEETFYTVVNPVPGNWTLSLENLTGQEFYNVVYAANTAAPQLTLTSPNNVVAGASLSIDWTVTPVDSTATVTLGYVAAADYATAMAAGEPLAATPIGPAQPATAGHYDWTIGALASGNYYIQARLDHPVHGVAYSYSPGTFRYQDTTPPAVPVGLFLSQPLGADNGLIAHWRRNTDADLYAYEVLYNSPDLDAPAGMRQRIQRIVGSDRFTAHPTHEQVRLVGLLPQVASTVCVRAIDNSGNVSPCSATAVGVPQPPVAALYYEPVLNLLVPSATNRSVNVLWGKNGLGTPDGYLLSWARGCAAGYAGPPAAEGQSNLDVGNIGSFRLTGLPAGNYRIAVRGYSAVGQFRKVPVRFSNYSNSLTTVLTNGVDGNGDGLADDWAEFFGVSGAATDSDEDGLTNGQEFTLGLDPTRVDSDDDGFHDNDELNRFGTNPCNPDDAPTDVPAVTLVVDTQSGEESLRFKTAGNRGQNPIQRLRIKARGQGTLFYEVSANQPWIKLSRNNGGPLNWASRFETVEVTVDTTGLTPGFYTGTVMVLGSSALPVREGVQRIPVRLWVLHDEVHLETQVTGLLFLDTNANGVQDAGESAAPAGIRIDLLGAVGAVLGTVTTNAAGAFSLDSLPYASYGLRVNHPDYGMTTGNGLSIRLQPGAAVVRGLQIGLRPTGGGQATDSDGDGVLDQAEDANGDGNLSNDDTDGDGLLDFQDNDDDGDGILTTEERPRGDSDGDGKPDFRDGDDDGDGIPTILERTLGDTDRNGIPNYLDQDDDGDSVATILEGTGDSNGDGTPDYLDAASRPTLYQLLLPVINR